MALRPEEVPVQFEPETIEFAMTTFMVGCSLFPGEWVQALGQVFAILVGDRMRIEHQGDHTDPAELLVGFHLHMEGRVPEEIRAEFTSLDPHRFEAAYRALESKAEQVDVGLDEICHALHEIAAVKQHFSDYLRDSTA